MPQSMNIKWDTMGPSPSSQLLAKMRSREIGSATSDPVVK